MSNRGLNQSLKIDTLEETIPVDLNGSYRFRNTPTRLSVGGYKGYNQLYQNSTRFFYFFKFLY